MTSKTPSQISDTLMRAWAASAGVPPSVLGSMSAGMSTVERSVRAALVETERFRSGIRMAGGDADAWTIWVGNRVEAGRSIDDARTTALSYARHGYPTPDARDTAQRWIRARLHLGHHLPTFAGGAFMIVMRALAYEIDDRRATLTGETICAGCGGRGERIVLLDVGSFIDPRFLAAARRIARPSAIQETPARHGRWRVRFVVQPCPCDGRRRPETVSLRRCVDAWTRTTKPWPELWMVNTDAMEANGWAGTVLPSGEHVPAWMCRWWRAFRQLALAREVPDVAPLFADLAALLPELEARARDRGSQLGAGG